MGGRIIEPIIGGRGPAPQASPRGSTIPCNPADGHAHTASVPQGRLASLVGDFWQTTTFAIRHLPLPLRARSQGHHPLRPVFSPPPPALLAPPAPLLPLLQSTPCSTAVGPARSLRSCRPCRRARPCPSPRRHGRPRGPARVRARWLPRKPRPRGASRLPHHQSVGQDANQHANQHERRKGASGPAKLAAASVGAARACMCATSSGSWPTCPKKRVIALPLPATPAQSPPPATKPCSAMSVEPAARTPLHSRHNTWLQNLPSAQLPAFDSTGLLDLTFGRAPLPERNP